MVAYSPSYSGGKARLRCLQLVGNCGEKFRSTSEASLASGKEETRSKSFLLSPFPGDRTSNGRLSCASHSVQPKHVCTTGSARPAHNFVKEGDSSSWQAQRFVLQAPRVEGCVIRRVHFGFTARRRSVMGKHSICRHPLAYQNFGLHGQPLWRPLRL